jgi:ArsR family transcriptional regulator, arsenate/arsenite/antimonite-responsive transcriptional repressor
MTAIREPALLPVIDDAACGPVVTAVPLAEADASALASVLSALADPVRLRLLSVVAAQGEVCSCHLQEPLGKSQPTISHHTRVLADAGLIEGDKRGKWTWWRIVPARLAFVRDALAAIPGTRAVEVSAASAG